MNGLLGIEIGGTKLQIVTGDSEGAIGKHWFFPVDVSAGAEGICKKIEEIVKELVRIQAVGIGFGGPVNRDTGTVWTSHQVKGWSGFPIREWMAGITGAPAVVENDANVAALAEASLGAERNSIIVSYVTLGSGVGAGLCVNKSIYHGGTPGEMELGHLRLDRKGTTLESRCSGWAINSRIREAANRYPSGVLSALASNAKGVEASILRQAMEAGDDAAVRIFNELVDDLSFGLSHMVHLVHPDCIIVGGGLAQMGDMLINGISTRLQSTLMEAFRPGPRVVQSTLGERAVPAGALLIAGQLVK